MCACCFSDSSLGTVLVAIYIAAVAIVHLLLVMLCSSSRCTCALYVPVLQRRRSGADGGATTASASSKLSAKIKSLEGMYRERISLYYPWCADFSLISSTNSAASVALHGAISRSRQWVRHSIGEFACITLLRVVNCASHLLLQLVMCQACVCSSLFFIRGH